MAVRSKVLQLAGGRERPPLRAHRLEGDDRLAGLGYARKWRERHRAYFDALYPDTVAYGCCGQCGQDLDRVLR